MSQIKDEPGKHRDPLDRRKGRHDEPQPEVLGVDIVTKLKVEDPKLYGNQKRA